MNGKESVNQLQSTKSSRLGSVSASFEIFEFEERGAGRKGLCSEDETCEIPEKIDWLAEMKEYDLSLFDNKKNKTDREVAKTLLPEIKAWLEEIDDFSNDNLFTALSEKAKEKGVKSGSVFWIMRIAITGMAVTPGGATEIAELLGKTETLARIDKSLGYLTK